MSKKLTLQNEQNLTISGVTAPSLITVNATELATVAIEPSADGVNVIPENQLLNIDGFIFLTNNNEFLES